MSKPNKQPDEKLLEDIQECFFNALSQHLPDKKSSKFVLILLDRMRAKIFIHMCNAKPERAKEIAQMIVAANLSWNKSFLEMAKEFKQPTKKVLH